VVLHVYFIIIFSINLRAATFMKNTFMDGFSSAELRAVNVLASSIKLGVNAVKLPVDPNDP